MTSARTGRTLSSVQSRSMSKDQFRLAASESKRARKLKEREVLLKKLAAIDHELTLIDREQQVLQAKINRFDVKLPNANSEQSSTSSQQPRQHDNSVHSMGILGPLAGNLIVRD